MNNDDVDLNELFGKYHTDRSIFRDRDKLRATYVPNTLPHRQKEIRDLANILGPIMAGGTPSNAFLYGKPGGGKTAVTKYVLGSLKENAKNKDIRFDYAYVNCNLIDTTYRVFFALCDALGLDDVPPTGLPTEEVKSRFIDELENQETRFLVVLDEIDLLLKKSSSALYDLTRMNTDLMTSKISLIGITNSVNFKSNIDARVRSTLTEQEIVFPPYTANQLKDILKERAREGFAEEVVDRSAFARAAALAASEHGDARRALDLLRVAGEEAEKDGAAIVTGDHVKKASEVIERNAVKEVVSTLPLHSKIVLSSIFLLSMKLNGSTDYITTGDTFESYSKICKRMGYDNSRILTQRRVGDLINELDTMGMITANVVSKGRYGRTRVINLTVDPREIFDVLMTDPRIAEVIPPYDEIFDF